MLTNKVKNIYSHHPLNTTNYLKRYCGQTLEVTMDMTDRNQDGLMG